MRSSNILPLNSPSSARSSASGGGGSRGYASPQHVARMVTSPRNDIAPRPPPQSTSNSEYATPRRHDPSAYSSSSSSGGGGGGSILPVLTSPAQVQVPPLRTPSPNAFKRTVWTTPRSPNEPPDALGSSSSNHGLQALPRRHSRSFEDDDGLPYGLNDDDSSGGSGFPHYSNDGDSNSYMFNPDHLATERADSPSPSSSSLLQSQQQGRRVGGSDNPESKPKYGGDDAAQLAYMEQINNTIQVLNVELEKERQDRTRLHAASSIDDEIAAALEYPPIGGDGHSYAASDYFDDPSMNLLVESTPSTASGTRRPRPLPSQQPKRPVPPPSQSKTLSKDQVELCATLGKNAELRIRTKEMEKSVEKSSELLDAAQKQMRMVERRISNREEKLRILMKEKLHWQKELKDMRDQVVEQKMRQVELFRRLETAKREGAAQMEQLEHDLRDVHDENQNLRAQVVEAKAHITFQAKKLDDVVRQARDEKEKLVSCIAETRCKFKEWKEGEAASLRSSREQAVNNVKTEYDLKIARHQEEKQKLREKVKDLEVSLRLMQKDRTLSPLELSLRKATILGSKDNTGTSEAELIEAHSRICELEALMEHTQEYQKRQENIIKVSEATISRLVQEREVTALENLSAQPLTGGFMNPMFANDMGSNNMFSPSIPNYAATSTPNVGAHRDIPKRQSYGNAKSSTSHDFGGASYGKPRGSSSNRIQPASSSPLLNSECRNETGLVVQPPPLASASASSFSLMTLSPSKLSKTSPAVESTPYYQNEDQFEEKTFGPQRQDTGIYVEAKPRPEVIPPEPIHEETDANGRAAQLVNDKEAVVHEVRDQPANSTIMTALPELIVSAKEQLLADEVARLQRELAELKVFAASSNPANATALTGSDKAEASGAPSVDSEATGGSVALDDNIKAIAVEENVLDESVIAEKTEEELSPDDDGTQCNETTTGGQTETPAGDIEVKTGHDEVLHQGMQVEETADDQESVNSLDGSSTSLSEVAATQERDKLSVPPNVPETEKMEEKDLAVSVMDKTDEKADEKAPASSASGEPESAKQSSDNAVDESNSEKVDDEVVDNTDVEAQPELTTEFKKVPLAVTETTVQPELLAANPLIALPTNTEKESEFVPGSEEGATGETDETVPASVLNAQEEAEKVVGNLNDAASDEKATEVLPGAPETAAEPELVTEAVVVPAQVDDIKKDNESAPKPEAFAVAVAAAIPSAVGDQLPDLGQEAVTAEADVVSVDGGSVPETDYDAVCYRPIAYDEEDDGVCLEVEDSGDAGNTLFFNNGELCDCGTEEQQEKEQEPSQDDHQSSQKLSVVGIVASNLVARVVSRGLHHSIVLHLEHRKYVAKTFVLSVLKGALRSTVVQLVESQGGTSEVRPDEKQPQKFGALKALSTENSIQESKFTDALDDSDQAEESGAAESSVAEQFEASTQADNYEAEPARDDDASSEQRDSRVAAPEPVLIAAEEKKKPPKLLMSVQDEEERNVVSERTPDDVEDHLFDRQERQLVSSQNAVECAAAVDLPINNIKKEHSAQSQPEDRDKGKGCEAPTCLSQQQSPKEETVAAEAAQDEDADAGAAIADSGNCGSTAADATGLCSLAVSTFAKHFVLEVQHEAVESILSNLCPRERVDGLHKPVVDIREVLEADIVVENTEESNISVGEAQSDFSAADFVASVQVGAIAAVMTHLMEMEQSSTEESQDKPVNVQGEGGEAAGSCQTDKASTTVKADGERATEEPCEVPVAASSGLIPTDESSVEPHDPVSDAEVASSGITTASASPEIFKMAGDKVVESWEHPVGFSQAANAPRSVVFETMEEIYHAVSDVNLESTSSLPASASHLSADDPRGGREPRIEFGRDATPGARIVVTEPVPVAAEMKSSCLVANIAQISRQISLDAITAALEAYSATYASEAVSVAVDAADGGNGAGDSVLDVPVPVVCEPIGDLDTAEATGTLSSLDIDNGTASDLDNSAQQNPEIEVSTPAIATQNEDLSEDQTVTPVSGEAEPEAANAVLVEDLQAVDAQSTESEPVPASLSQLSADVDSDVEKPLPSEEAAATFTLEVVSHEAQNDLSEVNGKTSETIPLIGAPKTSREKLQSEGAEATTDASSDVAVGNPTEMTNPEAASAPSKRIAKPLGGTGIEMTEPAPVPEPSSESGPQADAVEVNTNVPEQENPSDAKAVFAPVNNIQAVEAQGAVSPANDDDETVSDVNPETPAIKLGADRFRDTDTSEPDTFSVESDRHLQDPLSENVETAATAVCDESSESISAPAIDAIREGPSQEEDANAAEPATGVATDAMNEVTSGVSHTSNRQPDADPDALAALIECIATTAAAPIAPPVVEEMDRFGLRVTWSLPPEAESHRPAPTSSPKSRRTERRRTSQRLPDQPRYASMEQMCDPTLTAYDAHREQSQPFALLDDNIFSIDPHARHMQHDENDHAKCSESEIRAKRKNFDQDNHRKSIAFRSIPAFNYAPLLIRFQWSDFVIATPISVCNPSQDSSDKKAWNPVTSPVKTMRLLAKKGIKLACGSYVIISAFIRPLEDGNENLRIHIYDSEWVEEFQYDFSEDHLKAYMHEWSGRDDEAKLFMTQLEFRREEGGIIIKLPDKVGSGQGDANEDSEEDKRPTTAPAVAMSAPDRKEHPRHDHSSPPHRNSRHSHRSSSSSHGAFLPIRSLPNLSNSSTRENQHNVDDVAATDGSVV